MLAELTYRELAAEVGDWQRLTQRLRAWLATPPAPAPVAIAAVPQFSGCALHFWGLPDQSPLAVATAFQQRRALARPPAARPALERVRQDARLTWPLTDETPRPNPFAPSAISTFFREDETHYHAGYGLRVVASWRDRPVGYLLADLVGHWPRLANAAAALQQSPLPTLAATDRPAQATVTLDLELRDLYLLPPQRGQGLAAAMAAAAGTRLVSTAWALAQHLAVPAGAPWRQHLTALGVRVAVAPTATTVAGWRVEQQLRTRVRAALTPAPAWPPPCFLHS